MSPCLKEVRAETPLKDDDDRTKKFLAPLQSGRLVYSKGPYVKTALYPIPAFLDYLLSPTHDLHIKIIENLCVGWHIENQHFQGLPPLKKQQPPRLNEGPYLLLGAWGPSEMHREQSNFITPHPISRFASSAVFTLKQSYVMY